MHRLSHLLRTFLPAIAVAAVGVLLTLVVFVNLRSVEQQHAQDVFERVAQERMSALKACIDRSVNHLVSIRAHFDSSPPVSRASFARFVTPLLGQDEAVQAFEWIPRVSRSQRRNYEEAGRREGFPLFEFTEYPAQGLPVRAAERNEYFPVFFLEPFIGNEGALGFDLGSDPARREALEQATATGRLTATGRVVLVQETTNQYGVLIFAPVFRRGSAPLSGPPRAKKLTGFVLGVFRLPNIVQTANAIEGLGPKTLGVAIFDDDAKPGQKLLFSSNVAYGDVSNLPAGFKLLQAASVGERAWRIVIYALPGTFQPEHSGSSSALVAGILLSLLGAGYLHLFLNRWDRIKETVADRTAQLRSANKELEESEARYRKLLEVCPDPILVGQNQCIALVNRAAIELFKVKSAKELLGRRFADLVPPDRRARVEELMGRLYERETNLPLLQGQILCVDQSMVDVEVACSSFMGKDGMLVLGILRNISERKRAEEELRDSERFLRTVIDLVPHLIFVKDRASRYLLVNRTCAEAYGTTPEEMVGRSTLEIVSDPIQAEAFMKADAEVLDSGTAKFVTEEVVRDASGGRRLHQTNKVPFVSSRRGDLALIGIAVDITEYKRTQQALEESEDRLRTIVELAPDGIFVVSEQGQILSVNEAACKQLGYTRAQLFGLKIFDIVAPQFAERVAARLKGAVPSGTYESAHIRADGTEIPLELSVCKIVFGGQTAFIGITRDITERKRAEEEKAKLQKQLWQAQKLEGIGQLAGGVAHDFNNLLTVINGYGDLLLRKLKEGDPLRKQVAEIRRAGEQGAALTRQLLTFSRGQMVESKPLNLNDLIAEHLAILQRLVGEDIEIETVPGPSLGLVMADPGRMHQVLMNLAVNARDAMPRGGKFTIRTANGDIDAAESAAGRGLESGRFVLVQVSDTGTGIPKEIQDRIFDPFFTTKEPGKGTGLGLATVYGIVRHVGGSIAVRSEPGHGTTFDIYLPQAEVCVLNPARAMTLPQASRNTGTVLVVEDRPEIRELTVGALRSSGYRVLEATEGNDALRAAERHPDPIHLLLTDLIMPHMTGRELAEELKRLRPEIKVLYMSGYATDVISSRGLNSGEDYIVKPFSLDSLLAKVREVLNHGGSQRAS